MMTDEDAWEEYQAALQAVNDAWREVCRLQFLRQPDSQARREAWGAWRRAKERAQIAQRGYHEVREGRQ